MPNVPTTAALLTVVRASSAVAAKSSFRISVPHEVQKMIGLGRCLARLSPPVVGPPCETLSGGVFLRPQMRGQRTLFDDTRHGLVLMHALAFDRQKLLALLHEDGVD